MNKQNMKLLYKYNNYRNYYLRIDREIMVCFYQILIVDIIERSKFFLYKKNDLNLNWKLLNNLFLKLLEVEDHALYRAIYKTVALLQNENFENKYKENEIYFTSYIDQYDEVIFNFNNLLMAGIWSDDKERFTLYADNTLTLIEKKYGIENKYYAKIKLHIWGEYYYISEPNSFFEIFLEEVEYFEKYLSDYDMFYLDCIYFYMIKLLEKNNDNIHLWLDKSEKLVELHKGNKLYKKFKCRNDYIKASILQKQNQLDEAIEIIEKSIDKYIKIDKEPACYIYACMYLKAANIYFLIKDYNSMYKTARLGLELCEAMEVIGSELYYNLYNYIGIKFIIDNNLKEASKFYSKNVNEILKKYGSEDENYILYTNNLGIIALKEGRLSEANLYLNKLFEIEDLKLMRKLAGFLSINIFINATLQNDDYNYLEPLYNKFTKILEEDNNHINLLGLKTLYLSILVSQNTNSLTINKLIAELINYYKDDFISDSGMIYWTSILLHEWEDGNVVKALSISTKLIESICEYDYVIHRIIMIYHIQLLFLTKRNEEAEKLILLIIKLINKQIISMGFGDVSALIMSIRILLSIYINYTKINNKEFELKISYILEEILLCKTIEKEIRKLQVKYKSSDNKLSYDLYNYNQLHRKIAALKIKIEIEENYDVSLEERVYQYNLEKEECENNLRGKIKLDEYISEFKIDDIVIPNHSICIEYFAYYSIDLNKPFSNIFNNEDAFDYNYLMLAIIKEKGETKLKHVDIFRESSLNLYNFLDMVDAYNNGQNISYEDMDVAINKLQQILVDPIIQYTDIYKTIFLGLDFALQMLPFDIIYKHTTEEMKNIIIVDSVKYIEADSKVNFMGQDALIIGNPQYNINDKYKQMIDPLICSELECNKIADLLGVSAYVGKNATQKVFAENYQKNIIHISTHGEQVWEEDVKAIYNRNQLINSYILLAGFEDWKNNRKIKDYGNGLITGDDLLFTDLSRTQLVVLSACSSGLGAARGMESLRGMRWAIGVAGARYSITSLWEVEDCATAILMVIFYRKLKTLAVGEALLEAKIVFRELTLYELMKDNELSDIIQKRENLITDDLSNKPFNHWIYWAAFVCHMN